MTLARPKRGTEPRRNAWVFALTLSVARNVPLQ